MAVDDVRSLVGYLYQGPHCIAGGNLMSYGFAGSVHVLYRVHEWAIREIGDLKHMRTLKPACIGLDCGITLLLFRFSRTSECLNTTEAPVKSFDLR